MMVELNNNSPTPFAQLFSGSFSQFIAQYHGPKIGAIFYDSETTVVGNQDCFPLIDISNTFPFLADRSYLAFRFVKDGDVNSNLTSLNAELKVLADQHHVQSPEFIYGCHSCNVFYALFLLVKQPEHE
jgi:hypothetical protein